MKLNKISENISKSKRVLKPSIKGTVGSIILFGLLNVLTYPLNIFFTFQQALGAPLPYYVWTTCLGDGCPDTVTGLRMPLLVFNMLFCFVLANSVIYWKSGEN